MTQRDFYTELADAPLVVVTMPSFPPPAVSKQGVPKREPAATWSTRLLVAAQVVQAALLIDQSRTFTGSKPWLPPALAIPAAGLLVIVTVLTNRSVRQPFSLAATLGLVVASIAVYWPLQNASLLALAAAVAIAIAVRYSPALERIADHYLIGRLRWSLLKLGLLAWAAYIWCLIVQPPPVFSILTAMALPLPAAIRLATYFYPDSARLRWSAAPLLLFLLPALPGAVTEGRLVPIGFYSLLGLVLAADCIACLGSKKPTTPAASSPAVRRPQFRGWLAVVLISVFGLVLRLVAFASTSIPVGLDQFQYFAFADSITSSGVTTASRPLYLLGAPLFYTGPLTGVYLSYVRQLSGIPLFPQAAFLIVVVLALQIPVVFAFVSESRGGLRIPLLACFGWALAPAALDMQVWYGLANGLSLSLFLLLLLAIWRFWKARTLPNAIALVVYMSAAGMVHPLTATVSLAVLPLTILGLLLFELRTSGRLAWRRPLWVALVGALGLAVDLPDLYVRYLSEGAHYLGPWSEYLASRPDWHYSGWLLSLFFAVFGSAGVVLAWRALRRGISGKRFPSDLPLLVGSVCLLVGWLFGLRFPYARAEIFVAAGLVTLASGAALELYRRNLTLALCACAVFLAPHAGYLLKYSTEFFRYPDAQSIGALQWIGANTAPGDVLVVQQCQFSAATYFSGRPTMVAIPASQLASQTELIPTQAARTILTGAPGYQAAIDRFNVRTVMLDRGCQVSGALPANTSLAHLRDLNPPFQTVFDDGDVEVLHRP